MKIRAVIQLKKPVEEVFGYFTLSDKALLTLADTKNLIRLAGSESGDEVGSKVKFTMETSGKDSDFEAEITKIEPFKFIQTVYQSNLTYQVTDQYFRLQNGYCTVETVSVIKFRSYLLSAIQIILTETMTKYAKARLSLWIEKIDPSADLNRDIQVEGRVASVKGQHAKAVVFLLSFIITLIIIASRSR